MVVVQTIDPVFHRSFMDEDLRLLHHSILPFHRPSWRLGPPLDGRNAVLQIVFVMLLFPVTMNAIQYYIIDIFIKKTITEHDDHHRMSDHSDETMLNDRDLPSGALLAPLSDDDLSDSETDDKMHTPIHVTLPSTALISASIRPSMTLRLIASRFCEGLAWHIITNRLRPRPIDDIWYILFGITVFMSFMFSSIGPFDLFRRWRNLSLANPMQGVTGLFLSHISKLYSPPIVHKCIFMVRITRLNTKCLS